MIRGLTSNASRQAFHRAGAVQWASLASRTREVARWAVDVIAGGWEPEEEERLGIWGV